MPTNREIEDAAKKTPASRTTREQQIVDSAKDVGNQTAINLDNKARKVQKAWGR